jgi:hypothetical protein
MRRAALVALVLGLASGRFVLATAFGAVPAASTDTATTATSTATTSTAATTPSCPNDNAPNELKLVSGSPQTAKLGSAFAGPLQVALANSNGCPLTSSLAGKQIQFVAPSSGASGTFASSGSSSTTVGTDANGTATAPAFVANGTAGSYTVEARSDYGTVDFSLTNTASGVPSSIAATGQSDQQATVNSRYGSPLQAQVLDANGHGVAGVTVQFALGVGETGAGASFLGGGGQASAQTDDSGVATSPPVVANATPGRFTATASVAGASTAATFTLDNHAAVLTIAAAGATAQSATAGARFPSALQAQVRDASGQPLEGVTVTFAFAPGASGASASFLAGGQQATALTDANGTATSPPFVANGLAGRFKATASVAGAAMPVTYDLDNHAATTRVVADAAVQETTVGNRFPSPLRARVLDPAGKPLEGVTVTFALPQAAAGAGASFLGGGAQATAITNAAGWATSPPLVANGTPGRFTATASIAGDDDPVGFPLRAVAARVRPAVTTGFAAVDHRYPRPLAVRVLDTHGRPLAGVTVTFALGRATAGATAAFPDGSAQATATTDRAGRAHSPAVIAGSVAGSFAATATVAGSIPVRYRLRNLAGPPSTIAAGAASGEQTPAGSAFPIRLAVTVKDKDGNAVPHALVVFAVPADGPSGRFGTRRTVRVRTDADGIAAAPRLTANNVAGGWVAVARTGAHRTAFALVNT